MKTAIALATLLVASALAADGTHVYPLAPTTATPIEVHYLSSCRAGAHSVVRDGSEIIITARDPQCAGELPNPIVEKVKLPEALPIGEYNVTIQQDRQPFFITSTKFVVRNAGPKPFELHPSALYPNDEHPIRLSGVTCEKADCSDITVRVDGQPVGPLTVADDGAIWFNAPAHEEGLVDVSVQKSDFVMTSPGALYYFIDRYLLPFTFTRYEGGLRIEPWYAEVDLPPGVTGERVNVEIAMPADAIGWAFASVTNNETQQVTIVAPQ